MTTPLWQYTMVGQLTVPPYQNVYWRVYNAPDTNGTQSGYAGQLQNIAIAGQQQVTYPTNATPTIDANSLNGIPIANTTPSNGQALVFNATSSTYEPGSTSGAGGQVDVVLHNGLNSNVNTNGLSVVRIGGPTANFSIDGLSALPAAGTSVTFVNTTAFTMTLVGSGSASAFPLNTQSSGAPIQLLPKAGSFTVIGDQTSSQCVVQNVGIYRPLVFNVKDYGATGDGSTDDTAAVQTAAALFQAAMLAAPGAGYKLVSPPGKYILSSPIVIAGIQGGVIEGAGMFSSVWQDSGAAAFCGARAMLELQDCQHVTVRDIQIGGQAHFTRLSGNVAANATSIQVSSAANIAVGHRISLLRTSLLVAEEVRVTSVIGTTIGITGPAGSTVYSYSTSDFVIIGPLAPVCCSTNFQTSGKTSHGNKFERVAFNNSQSVNALYSFATDCLGGAPTVLASTITGGVSTSMTVRDATQLYVGQTIQMWDGIAGHSEDVTIATINPATGAVGISGTFAHNHTSGACYVVSASDVNNDEHLFHQCVALNGAVAYIGLQGWNSLNHLFVGCEGSGSTRIASYRQGGSLKWIGGDAGGGQVDFEIGGGIHRPTIISHLASEAPGQAIVVHSGDTSQGVTIWASHYDKKALPASGNIVDIVCSILKLSMHACNLIPGASAGFGLNFQDTFVEGTVTLSGQCRVGMTTLGLNGVTLTDIDTEWTGGAPTESPSNGGGVRSFAAIYGVVGAQNVGPTERRPVLAVSMSNGANDNVSIAGDADWLVTGPTGAYSFAGFKTGHLGQRQRIKFNVNQQLTIINNSSSGMPILTPTGANIVIPAAGAFVIRDFWCDGTNWNMVQGGTGP